jgi:hypothetical protein
MERIMADVCIAGINSLAEGLPPPKVIEPRFYRTPPEDRMVGYIMERRGRLVLALQLLDCQQCMAVNLRHEYAHVLDYYTAKASGELHGDGFYQCLGQVDAYGDSCGTS